MKKIFILGSKDSKGKNDVTAIARGISEHNPADYQIETLFLEDLIFDISTSARRIWDSAGGKELNDADLVVAMNWYKNGPEAIYRDVAYAVALFLEDQKIPFWNREMAMQRSTTKLSAMMQLAIAGFDVPHSVFSLSVAALKTVLPETPFILKSIATSRGKNNHLIKAAEDSAKILEESNFPNRLIAQEFIPNREDYRIVCFSGEPQMVIKRRRTSDETHLNNTSLGGEAVLVGLNELPDKILADCRAICELMGREMAGIDLIRSNDGSSRQVFLEVNAIPQLSSGSNVGTKLEMLTNSITNYFKEQS